MSQRILIVEDAIGVSGHLHDGLIEHGFCPSVAINYDSGLEIAASESFAAIILDLTTPHQSGMEICRYLQENRVTTPIMMIAAHDSVEDKVRGLEMGADDYLAKPFDFRELVARLHALIRRDKVHHVRKITIEDLEIDTNTFEVTRSGNPLTLSRREYELLEALATRQGRVLSREMIQTRIWGNQDVFSNTVDVFIGSLRKKIDDGHGVKLIHTVRGFGYVLKSEEKYLCEVE